jgi:hypothetical protein
MKREETTKDHAGLIAIKLGGDVGDRARSQGALSAAVQSFASEPLDWDDSGKALARLRREGADPTTSLRVLAIDQTLGAAVAIREAFVGRREPVALACDVEPIDADPGTSEYWVRRQRLDALVEKGGDETLCRRELSAARPLTLDRLRVHLEPTDRGQVLRLVAGPATELTWDVGRWVTPFVETVPASWERGGVLDSTQVHARRDIATIASPSLSTRVVLVLAEAWVGKSYVARQIWRALCSRGIDVHFTSFETNAPDWPDDEFLRRASPRVWIVDAVDEAERRGTSIEKLGRSIGGKGLSTLVFSRPDATLPDIEEALGFSERARRSDGIERSKLRLLPLDRDQARRQLAHLDDARFAGLLQAAEGFDSALTFEELRELERVQVTEPTPDLGEIRNRIARHRCTRIRAGAELIKNGGDEMFKAAQWLAAIAALTNERRFHFGELAPGFAVNDVVPAELRGAAHALQQTTALACVGSGWCFAPAHLEEDLAAGFLVDALTKGIARLKVHALRSLLTDGRGPRPELERVIQRAREGLEEGPKALLQEALKPFEAGEAVLRFREMVAQAQKSDRPLWASNYTQLEWLGAAVHDEVEMRLAGRQPQPVRHLALRVALANSWADLAPAAVDLALSDGESPGVRKLALLLGAKDSEQLDRLRVLFDRIPRDRADDELAEVRAQVVLALLQAGRISSLEAARLCPKGSDDQVDFRASAVAEVERKLDGDAARVILDELRGFVVSRTIDEWVCDELWNAAVSAFLTSPLDANGEDVDRVAYIVEAQRPFDMHFEFPERRQLPDSFRRAVYRQMDLKGKESYFFDPGKDAEWLVDSAGALGELPDTVRDDLFASIVALERGDQTTAAERGREILRREGLWDRFEAKLAAAKQWKAREQEWALARQKRVDETRKYALPVERVVDTFLGEGRDASLRLHALGDFFFGERLHGRNVVGTFEDLDESKQAEIMEATRSALKQATPLAIPEGNRFSSFLLDEGHAFTAAVLWKRDWLDPSQVARWLPAALFAAMDSTSRAEELIERCFAVGPAETRRAVIGDIFRCARQGYAQTGRVPALLWADDQFRDDLLALIPGLADSSAAERKALGGVLEALLEAYDSPNAPPEVRALLDVLVKGSDDTVVRDAVRAWFYRWPIESVDRAIAAAGTIENALVIFAPYYQMGMWRTRRELPAHVAARVVRHLLPMVPATPPLTGRRGGLIDDRDSLAAWRDRLVWLCIAGREEPELAEAIDAIRQHDVYASWLSSSEISENIEAALASPPRPWPTADEVASILHGTLALIHNVGDLALLVAEILRAPWDPTLSTLLYDGPKHRPERHLQVLLREKLIEGLRNVKPPVDALPIREPSERASDEPDFVVFTTNRPQRLEVPIEAKWSDNEPAAGLDKQLGDRYLGNAGRTHGIFVVGWTGTPRVEHLDATLEAARLRQVAKGRTIHVVLKEFLPPAATKTKSNDSEKTIRRPARRAATATRRSNTKRIGGTKSPKR